MNTLPANPAAALLAELQRRGIEVRAAGDRLRYRPREAVTPELCDQLKAHKAELLALLGGGGDEPRAPGEWAQRAASLLSRCDDADIRSDLRDLFEEFAAILEYDRELSRDEAERHAFGALRARVHELRIDVSCDWPAERPASGLSNPRAGNDTASSHGGDT